MKFDKDNHAYTIDGVSVPSVTQVLPEQNFYCSSRQLEVARIEGEENHSMIKMYYDTGSTADPMLAALDTWIKENSGMLGEIVLYEKSVYSKKHKFAGRPDAVYEKAVIDYKRTMGNPRYHALQLAGYHIAAVESQIIKKNKIWLVAWYDGEKFRAKNVYDSTAEAVFIALLERYKYDQIYKNYMEKIS